MVPEKNLLNRCSAIPSLELWPQTGVGAGWIERFTNLTAWASLFNLSAVPAMNHTRVA